ncbi:MAG: hypothetical protein EOM37_06355 [Proteobacteria bacterium]|jgi:hypothetical protein|nr:bifunctional DNA primase/polymerase [Alphaproteobacteria bacterium]NCC03652.1 hypothetical protein [Pseudomonadota bacterium]
MAVSSSPALYPKAQGPFGRLAPSYFDMGLPVIPCMGKDGKVPLVKWKEYQDHLPSKDDFRDLLLRFPDANIGLITGKLSKITVVDVDDPARSLAGLYEEFGETPVVTSTPRGGKHLYYRYLDEKNRVSAKKKIDVRGEGGYVIAPPSINLEKNKGYIFLEGDISFLDSLPYIKGSAPAPCDQLAKPGERNVSLFSYLIKVASNGAAEEGLITAALVYNAKHCYPALSENEVLKTVNSVRTYQSRGRLFTLGKQKIVLPPTDRIKPIMFQEPHALSLLADLIACHWDRKEFAISPKAYAIRSGWDSNTVRQAIAVLIKNKLIELVHKGGSRPGDPNLYRLLT